MNTVTPSPSSHSTQALRLGICVPLITLLSACAVSPVEVAQRYDVTQNEALKLDKEQKAKQAVQQAPVVAVDAPYISSRSITLAKEVRLPAVFKNSSSFVRPKNGVGFSLTEVADLISKRYGIRVRIRPDVFLPAASLMPGGGDGGSTSSGTLATEGAASPTAKGALGPMGSAGSSSSSGASSQPNAQYGQTIDFDFTGSLNDYLQRLSAVMGISSEWDDGAQELLFYRLVTRTFTLDTTPSTQSTKTNVSKTSTGSGSSGSSSGSANSQTAMDSDTWAAVEKALNTFKTKAGSVVVNRGTRTITVIDTKDVVEMAARFLGQQNEVLSRQAMLSVKLVRVALSRETQQGVNLNLAFEKYLQNAAGSSWGLNVVGGGSLVKGSTGNMTYSVLSPNSRFNGTNVVASFMNEIGKVTDEYSQDIPVRNNRTVPVMDFATYGYLSKTTPATGGTGGTGVPGLETSTVTSGTLLLLTPSIKNNESLVLSLGLDRSADPTFETISTGSGITFQQVQLLRQRGVKIDTEIGLKNQETLIIMGLSKDALSGGNQWGLTGASSANNGSREVQFLIITPKIISGG